MDSPSIRFSSFRAHRKTGRRVVSARKKSGEISAAHVQNFSPVFFRNQYDRV